MSFLNLFLKPDVSTSTPNYLVEDTTDFKNFGRFCDALNETETVKLFDAALQQFEENDYLTCFRSFFNYITNKNADNILISEMPTGLTFEVIQGSKKIIGWATAQKIYAQSQIAHIDVFNVRYLRQLIESNFVLMYCRFALDADKNIVLLFESVASEASPYKLLEGMRELAIHADKNDDILVDEFREQLQPLDLNLRKNLSPDKTKFFTNYLIDQIETTAQFISDQPSLNENYAGGVAYLWLALAYQFDYLLAPQGYIADTIERIERLFFEKSSTDIKDKNLNIRQLFNAIKSRSPQLIAEEFYQITSTFSIMPVKQIDTLARLIEGELPNMNWYRDNGYPKIALAVTDFIVGNAQFNHCFPEFERKLLHLYWQVRHYIFFAALGLKTEFKNAHGELNAKNIKIALSQILFLNRFSKKETEKMCQSLSFQDEMRWAASYLEMIIKLAVSNEP